MQAAAHASAGALSEQDLLCLLILGKAFLASPFLLADFDCLLHRWTPKHGVVPALQIRKLVQVLSLVFMRDRPADCGHVGDRVIACEERPVGKSLVHHAVEAVHFIGIAVYAVGDPMDMVMCMPLLKIAKQFRRQAWRR